MWSIEEWGAGGGGGANWGGHIFIPYGMLPPPMQNFTGGNSGGGGGSPTGGNNNILPNPQVMPTLLTNQIPVTGAASSNTKSQIVPQTSLVDLAKQNPLIAFGVIGLGLYLLTK